MPESPKHDGAGAGPRFFRSHDPRSAAMYFALLAIAILIAAASSRFGRDSVQLVSVDFALHMIVVEEIYDNARLADHPGEKTKVEGVMASYPRWSHALVGYSAALLDADPLRAIQLWVAATLVAGCLVMALRLAHVGEEPPALAAIVATALFLAACAYGGFGLRGHIEGNYFFPQLFGSVVAIGAFEVLRRLPLRPYIAALVVLVIGAFVLPNIHLLAALWFTLASLITLLLRGSDLRISFALCFVVGVISLAAWTGFGFGFGDGAAMMMIRVADNNGIFITRNEVFSAVGTKVGIGLAIVLAPLALAAVVAAHRGPWRVVRLRLVPHAGLIAICILIVAQAVLYKTTGKGSVYAITKYFYLFATETAVLLAVIGKPVFASADRFLRDHAARTRSACVILFFLAQAPLVATPFDQSVLMEIRSKLVTLRKTLDPENRAYPQFSVFDYAQNIYLALAVMRMTTDGRTWEWTLRGATGERPFAWPAGSGIDPLLGDDATKRLAPPQQYAHTVRLRTEYPLVESGPGVFTTRRPAVLHVEIVMPHLDRFRLAAETFGRKGQVLFGIQAFDEATGKVVEKRSVFERVQTPDGVVLRTEMKLSDLPPSVSRIDIGPLQEFVTWFHMQSPANLRRLEFSPGWVQRGARNGEFIWPPDADATPVARK